MKKSKFTEAQIVFALHQAETGTRVGEVYRKMGISDATFYNWKKKYGGLGTSELRRLRQLEDENYRLKKLVADQLFDGRRFRALTVVDNYSRKCLAIHVGQSIKGEEVTAVVRQLSTRYGRPPGRIQTDNGSEFISKALDQWAYDNGTSQGRENPPTTRLSSPLTGAFATNV